MSIVTDNIKTDSYLSKDGTREYGRCTAWVNFDGTGVPTIRDSLNVASITDNGTGTYNINFSSNFTDTNYVVVGGGERISDSKGTEVSTNLSTKTISSVNILVNGSYPTGVDYRDSASVMVAIFGGDA